MGEIHMKIVTNLIFPFILSIFLFIIIGIKKKRFMISQIFMNFFIAFFIMNQAIFSKLFELITCSSFQFDEDLKGEYLSNYLGIECYDNFHYLWIYLLIIPSFIFYGMIVPISTIIFAYRNKDELKIEENIIKYDFLMRQPYISKDASIWFFFIFSFYLLL